MSMMRLSAMLMLCGSALAINAASMAAHAADGAGIQFGAPALPVSSFAPRTDAAPTAAAPHAAGATPWVLSKPKPQEVPAPQAEASNSPNLDALRFYAGQNDLARVAAEIRLLRAKYPGWEPPTDLFTASKGGESEQPLWDLFAKHDLDGLKAAIADKEQQTPGWQPSSDLLTKIDIAESYAALVQASDRKDYGTVVDLAASHHGLMTCANVDAVWRTAEALALTDDEPRALEAYRYVLANCTSASERLATVQKANQVLKSPEAIDGLIRMGKRLPNGLSEFADVRLDGVRQRVGDAAAGKTTTLPSQEDLDQLTARAKAAGGGKDAELLGWYALGRKDYPGAETWFRAAMLPQPSSKAAEGLVLALRDGGKMDDAAKLAPQYAALGPLNRKLMMEILVAHLNDAKEKPTADQLAMIGTAIDAERSADAAQSFGWFRFKAADLEGADAWFKKSMDWQPNEAAAIGLMVTARRLKHTGDYDAVVTRYKDTFPKVASLSTIMKAASAPGRPTRQSTREATREATRHVAGKHRAASGEGWDPGATAIVQTFEGGNPDQALAMMDQRRANRPEPRGLSVVRGWALYKKGDWEGARRVFTEVGQRGMADEAEKGLKQIELGYTNPRYR